ncbi:asparaginase [Weissella ceti]|uniref:asparaginase n=1 Tax=Weissella ceti TaxID=759620 RepID=A0ABT3E6A3_9LACO|nr:asparaginase [Weissella ceti]MCW0953443.1 asparaginase [Weissella ceti]QVK12046.1 asparaginase [Weissella ceti]
MQEILILTTGGTIASQETDNGLAPGLPDEQLMTYFEPRPGINLSIETVMNKDSSNMQPEDWLKMAERVQHHVDDYDAFIITHGTDTMAYTAAALSYLLNNVNKPIVITGSQVPLEMIETDAIRNLHDSLTVASQADLKGGYLVFNGLVMAGTRAIKTKSKSYGAFESINYPYIASVGDGQFKMLYEPRENDKIVMSELAIDTNVFVLKAFPGMPVEVFDYLGDTTHGVIIESFGNGGLPFARRNLIPAIEKLTARGIPVIITTQILEEGQDINLYEVGKKVADAGGITVGDMNTEAAVAKLMWVLADTRDLDKIRVLMQTPIAHDLNFV